MRTGNINSADTLPALEAIKTQLEARRRGINTKITALFATPGPADKTRRTELNEELDAVEYLFTQLNSRQQMLEANAERLSVVRRQAMIDAETDRVLAEMFPDVPREDLDPNVIRLAEHVAQTEIDRQLTAGGENPPTITVPEANPVRRRPLELAKAILKKIREAIPRKKENIPQAENTEIILRVIYRGLTEPTDIAYFKKLLKRIVTAEPANYTADTKDLLRVIASISEPTALAYVQTPTWTEQSDFLR